MKTHPPRPLPEAIAGICLSALMSSPTLAEAPDLTDLSVKELLEVEITLEDAFDIFGALVQNQQVSVATGRKQDAARAPAVTSVITAQDLEAMGARTLSEALESMPGLHVGRSSSYQARYIAKVYDLYKYITLNLIKSEHLI